MGTPYKLLFIVARVTLSRIYYAKRGILVDINLCSLDWCGVMKDKRKYGREDFVSFIALNKICPLAGV